MADYLVQEDGFKINLEDGTGALLLETDVSARVTQTPVEVVVQGDSEARVTQTPVEALVKGDGSARVTQVPVEVIMQNTVETVNLFFINLEFDD